MNRFRLMARSRLDSLLTKRLTAHCESEWRSSSVVIAPHPDDETLGCGGVACKKIAAGAKVHFVFVTDGTGSHSGMSLSDLKTMRELEAVEAVCRLGAGRDDVTFLGIPDGSAASHVDEIAKRLVVLFDELSFDSVFFPHPEDPLADHVAVHRAVRQALDLRQAPVTVFEYPIWYWYHWPWVPIFGDGFGMWKKALRQTIATRFGKRAVLALNTSAYVGDVLAQKQAALAAHVSQTSKPVDEDDWPILSEVGQGGFLARLMSEYELFNRYQLYGEARE